MAHLLEGHAYELITIHPREFRRLIDLRRAIVGSQSLSRLVGSKFSIERKVMAS